MAEHNKKERIRFTTKIVVSAVTMTTLYTIACFMLAIFNIQNHTTVNVPAELTALFFGFWTVEIIMLTTLDRTKVKNKYHHKEEKDDGQTGE